MATETLRPNAAGDEENIPSVVGDGVGTHWTTVDEVIADDLTSYVHNTTNVWTRDLYNIEPHVLGLGTINSVTVWARCRSVGTPDQTSLKIAIKTGGVAAEGAEVTLTTAFVDYSNTWNTNPQTGLAWGSDWAVIDAVQAGENLRRAIAGSASGARCTQLWIVVDYTASVDVTITLTATMDATGATSTPATTVQADMASVMASTGVAPTPISLVQADVASAMASVGTLVTPISLIQADITVAMASSGEMVTPASLIQADVTSVMAATGALSTPSSIIQAVMGDVMAASALMLEPTLTAVELFYGGEEMIFVRLPRQIDFVNIEEEEIHFYED